MSHRLTRRAVLRGVGGVAITLPWLEALAQPAPPPKRFIGVYHPNGVHTGAWFPTAGTSETDFTLGPTHQPLASFKDRLLLTSGLDLGVAVTGPGEQHQRGLGALLTGAKLGSGSFVGNDGSTAGWAQGRSIDQELVGLIGQGTRIGSLQLGVHTAERDVSGALSYAGANQPLLPQNDPRLTFKTLFLDTGMAPTELDRLRARRQSVLDAVKGQLTATMTRVSTADRARLDRHLTELRALEERVTALPSGACAVPMPPGTLAFDTEAAMPEVAALQFDLLALAFACDLTRVATVTFSDAKNHIAMPFLCRGTTCLRSDVHNLSHLGDADPTREPLQWRDQWVAQQLATLLTKLQAATEGAGTILDRTLLWWGSDVSRGNVHAHDDMPILLAGGGAGFRMGRFVTWQSRQHNDLLVSILRAFGSTATSWGEPSFCTGPLSGLS